MKKQQHRSSRTRWGVSSSFIEGLTLPALFLLFCVIFLFPNSLKGQSNDSWGYGSGDDQHEVTVEARIVPFYAVDSDSNPVYDLKQEELQVFINKKNVDILSFSRYRFSTPQGEQKPPSPDAQPSSLLAGDSAKKAAPGPAKPAGYTGRFVFIIYDSVFNSTVGLRRSEKIFKDIIAKSPPGDAFIIIENNPASGFKYIAGPSQDRPLLLKALSKLTKINTNHLEMETMQFSNEGLTKKASSRYQQITGGVNSSGAASFFQEAKEDQDSRDGEAYCSRRRSEFLTFAKSLSNLEFAFKTITRPKIVYLVSEGSPEYIFTGMPKSFYYGFLKKAAKGINKGGSLLYVINPAPQRLDSKDINSGKEALKLVARVGNGKYFEGNDTNYISQRLRKSTAAYYELAFCPKYNKQLKVRIKSKRKGVKIYSIKQIQKKEKYGVMKDLQRKMFALNVITGGGWSRVVAEVDALKYSKKGAYIKKGKTFLTLETALLPAAMRERNLDVFTINIDPGTLEADIKLTRILADEKMKFKAKQLPDRQQYFVIIEPETTTCRFSRVL